MVFSLPADLPEDWVDNIGMVEDADYLNKVGIMGNAIKAALLAIVNGSDEAVVATNETCSSSTYGNLATTGPAVTGVQIGSSGKALVIVRCKTTWGSGSAVTGFMSFAASGANTIAAADTRSAAHFFGFGGAEAVTICSAFLLKGLSAGATDFTAKFRVPPSTSASFSDRGLIVIPFP